MTRNFHVHRSNRYLEAYNQRTANYTTSNMHAVNTELLVRSFCKNSDETHGFEERRLASVLIMFCTPSLMLTRRPCNKKNATNINKKIGNFALNLKFCCFCVKTWIQNSYKSRNNLTIVLLNTYYIHLSKLTSLLNKHI